MKQVRARNHSLALLSIIAIAAIAFLGKGYEVTLRGIDSNIHAAAAMNVTARGLLPVLPIPYSIYPDGIFNDHPFTLFWLNGWIMRALGPDAWSARLLTAGFAVGSVWLTYRIAALLLSPTIGLLAALILALTRDFVLTAGTFSLDTGLVFFILLSFWHWLRGRPLLAGLAAGIGLWIKTPVVLLLYPTVFLASWIQKRLRADLRPLLQSAGVAVATGAAFWIAVGALGDWSVVRDYWVRQLWGTAVGGRGQNDHQWTLIIYTLKTGFLPGLPLLIWGLGKGILRGRWRDSFFLIPLLATLIISTVVTLMRFKLGHYFTPIFPFLAIISAYAVGDWLQKNAERFCTWLTGFAVLLGAFLVVTPTSLAPEPFDSLRKFEALIARSGKCDEQLWLVPGGEPVGGPLDYKLHLLFYTGREPKVVECRELGARLAQATPDWMILSAENYRGCLGDADRSRFRSAILIGNQILASRNMSLSPVADLTPLYVEGKAVTDCKPPAYPRDMWHRYAD